MAKSNKKVETKKLGRGLADLFGETNLSMEVENIQNDTNRSKIQVDIEYIVPNPFQPRFNFEDSKLVELASSIKEYGVITPVLLRKKSDTKYEIVAGERRFRASKLAGLKTIPAIIEDFDDNAMLEIAIVENVQREDLNAIEEARAYQNMLEVLKLTQDKLAQKVGKSRPYVANMLRLLVLPEDIQQYVLDGVLTMGHVKPLINLDKKEAKKIANLAVEERLSVRQVEDLARNKNMQRSKKVEKQKSNPTYVNYSKLINKKLSAKTKIKDNEIRISFDGENDLKRIMKELGLGE